MKYHELMTPIVQGLLCEVEGVNPAVATEISGHLSVSGLIALPVKQIACHLDQNIDLEILDEGGDSIGTLCLTAKLAGSNPQNLTKWQYVAYLTDVPHDQAGKEHVFSCSYVVIKADRLADYLNKWSDSAPLWGGFSHAPSPAPIVRQATNLVARSGIIFPTRFHRTNFSRYIAASNGFERFLRLYHSLELIFDFVIFKSIQKLGDDMVGFGAISRSHGRSEIERLRYIVSEFCDNHESIARSFLGIANFEVKAEEIFQDYSKDGNPLDAAKWRKLIDLCRAGQVAEVDFIREKLCDRNQHSYKKFVSNVSSYWIYRVRSSIAHSRVSEFLFEDSDEGFIVNFAENVLDEVVNQVLTGGSLQRLT